MQKIKLRECEIFMRKSIEQKDQMIQELCQVLESKITDKALKKEIFVEVQNLWSQKEKVPVTPIHDVLEEHNKKRKPNTNLTFGGNAHGHRILPLAKEYFITAEHDLGYFAYD